MITYYVVFHTPYCLTAGTLKSFIRWLVLSIRGNLDEYITRHSVSVYMRSFMALWPQLSAFLASQELKDLAPISTRVHVKHVADIVDVEILIRAFWADKKHFRTHRMRVQMVATINLSAISSERPGAVVESTNYRHSNQCIEWRDLEFVVIPNKDHPYKPVDRHHCPNSIAQRLA